MTSRSAIYTQVLAVGIPVGALLIAFIVIKAIGWVADPGGLDSLGWFVVPAGQEDLLRRPWAALSYALVHTDLLHLGFNALWLIAFGLPLARACGAWSVSAVMAVGAIAGAVGYSISATGIDTLMGASAAVLAVAAAALLLRQSLPTLIAAVALIAAMLFAWHSGMGGSAAAVAHLAGLGAGVVCALVIMAVRAMRRPLAAVNEADEPTAKAALSGYASLSGAERDRLYDNSLANTSSR